MQGYEKALVDISKELNKEIEINAIVPKNVTEKVKNRLFYIVYFFCYNKIRRDDL